MGYRQIFIKRSEKISFKNSSLIITRDSNDTKIPLEDINYILLEDNTTIITARLLAELGKNSIALIVCDERHEPTSIMYPYNFHYKQLENIELQLSQRDDFKDLLWTLLIKSKIENQLNVLKMRTNEEKTIEKLNQFIEEIEIGDITNREGLAAKMYFRSLFGNNFIRFYDDGINSALNYGYTIIKSCIIRNFAIFGLNSYIGIHHKSKTNNFNLAYDFIEPFRAIVDKHVYDNIDLITSDLSFEMRTSLVEILNKEVIVNSKYYTVEYAIELLVKSYIKSMSTGEIKLDLPLIIYDK